MGATEAAATEAEALGEAVRRRRQWGLWGDALLKVSCVWACDDALVG